MHAFLYGIINQRTDTFISRVVKVLKVPRAIEGNKDCSASTACRVKRAKRVNVASQARYSNRNAVRLDRLVLRVHKDHPGHLDLSF